MAKVLLLAVVCSVGAWSGAFGETSLAELASGFFFEGTTITLPVGTYTVLGDAIATVADNVVTCKKAGFTLVNDGTTDYRLCVVPRPASDGDVFYYLCSNTSGDNWTSVTWTKVTQNTSRTYPNHASDIAVFQDGCYGVSMFVDADISIHGYVVGATVGYKNEGISWIQTANGSTLTFCGTEKDPAFINLTTTCASYPCWYRFGTKETTASEKTLNIVVASKLMNVDFCGDSSAVVAPYRSNYANFQICSAIITVPDGNTLQFVNGSRKATDKIELRNKSYGYITGAGTVRCCLSDIPRALLTNANGPFAGSLSLRSASWGSTSGNGTLSMPNVDLEVSGVPKAGRNYLTIGDTVSSSNPGKSQIDVKSLTLDGGMLLVNRNYADNATLKAWTNGTETAEEYFNKLTVTNRISKLILKGDNAMYCDRSHGENRVRQYVYLDDIERPDGTASLLLYGFNFNDSKPSVCTSKYYDRVLGDGLAKHAVGRDPVDGDSSRVYKIIPWIACTVNDNHWNIYHYYGSQMTFPALTNGVLMSRGRTSAWVSGNKEWENIYFSGKGISLSADTVINSLAYCTGETVPYSGNLVIGAGRKLTIKSGGMIFGCSSKWFGATQTANFSKCGTVAFGGEHAYLISDYGVPTDTSTEYNTMWAAMVATNGLVKCGCGELVIAADQRGVDGTIWVNGGTLWLGHPANYRQVGWLYNQQAASSATIPVRGCATDVTNFTVRAGCVLGIPLAGYDADSSGAIADDETAISRTAIVNLEDNLADTAKLEIAAGADQTCQKLYVNGVALNRGTYGATGSGAANIDDDHFLGTGTLTVLKDDHKWLYLIFR